MSGSFTYRDVPPVPGRRRCRLRRRKGAICFPPKWTLQLIGRITTRFRCAHLVVTILRLHRRASASALWRDLVSHDIASGGLVWLGLSQIAWKCSHKAHTKLWQLLINTSLARRLPSVEQTHVCPCFTLLMSKSNQVSWPFVCKLGPPTASVIAKLPKTKDSSAVPCKFQLSYSDRLGCASVRRAVSLSSIKQIFTHVHLAFPYWESVIDTQAHIH